ncbi:MAG: hypothetical protein IT350_14035 [Deltaproteobacteria bacterium]|nr:hypothetical protein [Deltaproteobacteria bacterium]
MLGALNVRTQALLLTALIAAMLAIVVWTRKERSRTTLPFSIFNGVIVAFASSYVGVKITGDHNFLRAMVCAAAFVVPSYLYLIYSYVMTPVRWLDAVLVALFGAAAVFSVSAFIPQFDTAIRLVSWFPPGARSGRVALAILAISAPAFLLLVARFSRERETVLRRRYRGLIAASGATIGLCAFAEAAGGGGPVAPVALMSYQYYLFQSVVRYQSFSLGTFAVRTIMLVTSTIFLMVVYGLFFYLVRPSPVLFVFHTLVVAFMMMVIYDPLFFTLAGRAREWIQRGRGDVVRRIDVLVAELAEKFALDEIGEFLAHRVPAELGLTGASVYLARESGGLTRWAGALHGPELLDGDLAEDLALLRGAESRAQMTQRVSESYAGAERDRYLRLLKLMEGCSADWLIAMRYREELVGAYLTAGSSLTEHGPESGSRLEAIADQAAVRIVNARIYQKLRAQDRMATLGELAASLAHEIRNPLGSMKGAAQYLVDEPLSATAREFVEIIVAEADRLNRVLTRFLDYARPFALKKSPCNINDVIRQTVAFLREGEMPRELRIESSPDPGASAGNFDREQIRQVLINLLKNAWEAQPPGGEVLIATRRVGSFLNIEIADRAPTIGPSVRAQMFTPFFTTKETGSGLGLPISQRIVQAHGGRIVVRERDGGGNVFTIELPVAGERADAVVDDRADAAPGR